MFIKLGRLLLSATGKKVVCKEHKSKLFQVMPMKSEQGKSPYYLLLYFAKINQGLWFPWKVSVQPTIH